jgi:hypothetical protein
LQCLSLFSYRFPHPVAAVLLLSEMLVAIWAPGIDVVFARVGLVSCALADCPVSGSDGRICRRLFVVQTIEKKEYTVVY